MGVYHAARPVDRDFNLVLSILAISSVLVVVINLFLDFVYAWLDPRIEMR